MNIQNCGLRISQSLKRMSEAKQHSDEICTVSTIGALAEGLYDGVITCKTLLEHGDFGLGTFDHLDGEMMLLDGKFYRGDETGKASEVSLETTAPYAAVKYFMPDREMRIESASSMQELAAGINDQTKLPNVLLAIRIDGTFEYVQYRTMPRQEKPYRPLAEVAAEEPIFELNNVRGTALGFRFPAYTGEVGVTGYHLHFLTEDRTAGGHILQLRLSEGLVQCDISRELKAILPECEEFDSAELNQDHAHQIQAAEDTH